MTAPPTVRVLLFSVLRERIGREELRVPIEPAATGAALLDRLQADYPAVADYRPYIRLAVNRQYRREDAALADGDEVALITPVSGG